MSDQANLRVQRLRDAGYKLTNARLTILTILEQHGGHMTSADVLEEVDAVAPEIGRASVFRSLDLFTRLSLIRPTYINDSSTPTYVLLPGGHHHHIICTNCDRVIEFEDCHLEKLEHELEQKFRVRLTGHLLEFYGLCDNCAARQPD
ncbi:MAG: transcriptional repressor [Anaerolineae bacterium]|nr:transcriptional repressor [Anaerolineae bacterium]